MRNSTIRKCSICSTPLKNSQKKYCSWKCNNKSKVTSFSATCSQCGKKTTKIGSKSKNKYFFCNSECQKKFQKKENHPNWTRITKPCTHCSKPITKARSQFSKRPFCTHACYSGWLSINLKGDKAPNWKGGIRSAYGDSWKLQRRLARKRDKYICQHCGVSEKKLGQKLDVHHKVPFRKFGKVRHLEANHLDNLICLCKSCHQRLERSLP